MGGLVIALAGGATTCYVLNASCSAVVIESDRFLAASCRTARSPAGVSPPRFWPGFVSCSRTDLILATITLDLFAVLLGGATALLPIYARTSSDRAVGLGWLGSPIVGRVFDGTGACTPAADAAGGQSLLWAVAGFGIATIVFGLSRNPSSRLPCSCSTGALDNISVVVRQSLIVLTGRHAGQGLRDQRNLHHFVQPARRLRVRNRRTAVWPGGSVVGGGVGTLLVVLCVAAIWPNVSSLGSLQDVDTPTKVQETDNKLTAWEGGLLPSRIHRRARRSTLRAVPPRPPENVGPVGSPGAVA